MNKTITLMAVVLGLLTAFLMVSGGMDADEIDYNGYDYFVIDDADTVCYTDATLPEDVDDCNGRVAITTDTVMENAFKDCTRIKHVYFDGTESIGDHAFDGCTNLYTVAAESGLESIGSYAFKNCSKFYTAKFPSTLETLGSGCFFGCSKLIGSVLLGTSVTTIPSYAFADSGILIEDLRNVTTIAATAFNGTSLKAQVLSEGQSKKVAGVDAIYVADFAIKNLQMYSVTVGSDTDYYASFKVNKNVSLMSRALDGSCSANNSEDQPWVYGSVCEFKMDGDLHLELLKYRIVFEDYLNMADVVHTSGTGTYAMPSPSIGSSVFNGWRIAGLSGLKTSLTEAEFQTAGLLIEPVAEFQTLTLTLDHSAVSGSADYASLPTEMEFTVNDSYPAQADIAGFTFSGWRCGEIFYAAGT